jgi:hypothetical protein
MTVCVGTGTQEDQVKVASLQQLLGVQQGLMMNDPMNPLCDYSKIHNTLKSIINLTDIGESDQFLYDPQSPEGQQFGMQKQQEGQQQQQQMMQQQQQQLEMQQATVQSQMKVADAEMGKAQATMQNGQLKAQIDAMKNQHTQELEQLKTALQAAKDNKAQEFQVQQLKTNTALKLTELEIQANRDLNKDLQDNQGAVDGSGSTERSTQGSRSAS